MNLNGEKLYYQGRVTIGDGGALLFINLVSLPALIEAAEINMDVTFHSAPRGFYQLGVLQVDCAIYSHFLISQFKVPHFL
jgi:hypothetical protein